MALLRLCFELGRTPEELEDRLDAASFLEMVAFLKMKADAEKKAVEEAKRSTKRR